MRLAAITAAACAAALATAGGAAASPTVYVTQSGEPEVGGLQHAVAVYDLATGKQIDTFNMPKPAREIAIDPAGQRAYVSVTDGVTFGVTVVDIPTQRNVKTIPNVGGDVAVAPSGKRVFVSDDIGNAIDVIGTGTNTVTGSIPVGDGPRSVVVDSAGKHAYTGNYAQTGPSMSVVDLAAGTHTDKASVFFDRPENIGIAPDGKQVYLANFGASAGGTSLAIYDVATGGVQSVTVGTTPDAAVANPSGTRVYVANRDSSSLSIVNPATATNVGTIPLPFRPTHLAIAPDGRRAVVTSLEDAKIAFLDLVAKKILFGPSPLAGAGDVAIRPTQAPVAAFLANPGISRTPTSFDATPSRGGPIRSYRWTFGDGKATTRTVPTVKHAYAKAGRYSVTLTTTNICAPNAVFGPLGVAFAGRTAYCLGPRKNTKTSPVTVPKAALTVVRTDAAGVGGDRVARIRLACVRELRCDGRVTLRSAEKIRLEPGGPRKRFTLGSAAFDGIKPGNARTVKVKLSKRAQAALRSRGELAAVATARTDNPGGRTLSRSRPVSLSFSG